MQLTYRGIKIESGSYLLEDGNGFEASSWADEPQYDPTPKAAYTIGGVMKRSVPNSRFAVKVSLVFADATDFNSFKTMFYDSTLEYLTITFSNNPPGKTTNVLAMNFDGDFKLKPMASSIEATFTLVEIPHVRVD